MRTLRRLYGLIADPEMPIYVTCPGKTYGVMYRSKKVARHHAIMAVCYGLRESVVVAAIKIFIAAVALPHTLFFINRGSCPKADRIGVRQRLEALTMITIVAVVAAVVWLIPSGTHLRWHITAMLSAAAFVLLFIGHLILRGLKVE